MNDTSLRPSLLLIACLATLPLFGATATATAGATIVDRISVGSAAVASPAEGNRVVEIDSSSPRGPLAVSIEVDSNGMVPQATSRIADDLRFELPTSPGDEQVVVTIHSY